MTVLDAPRLAPTPIDGVAHATLASHADGLTQLSVWRQSMAPGACTPPHRHDCDEVVLCLAGEGELRTAEGTRRFGAGSTLVLPGHRDHQFFNVGAGPLETVGIFAATPVVTRAPDGAPMDLPWRT